MEQKTDVILRETVTEQVLIDSVLSEMVRELVIDALKEAKKMLEFGLADQKMALIRTLLNGATRSLGKDFTSTETEAKVAVTRLFDAMRELDEDSDAAPIAALAPRTDDSD